MNIFDIVVFICLGWGIVEGLRKGFISQVVSIVALVLGVWLSVVFAGQLSVWMKDFFTASPAVLKTFSFIVIFIVVTLGLTLLGKMLEKVIRLVMLGWLNRLLGVVFSLLKWMVIICLCVAVFDSLNTTFSLVGADKLDASLCYRPVQRICSAIFPYLKSLVA